MTQARTAALPPIVVAVGISGWKRDAVRRMVADGGPPVRFADRVEQAIAIARSARGAIAAWPSREPDELADAADAAGIPLVRVEDGFIRSVGLGAGLVPPCSLVLDRRGIYYDPTRPSDLEHLLEHDGCDAALSARAERLARRIVAEGIGKYDRAPPPPAVRRNRPHTVLVAGQVEDDRSVQTGGAGIRSNLDLLVRARAIEPNARLLFKPHPDVDAGYRTGRVPDATLLGHADEIVRAPMPVLLAQVDAVHVLTSLTGFEALLRGLPVTAHGHPFYAGWGLTRDLAGPLPRRTARLTLPALVAGALIRYPRYLDPATGRRCGPEELLDRFASGWRPRATWTTRARRWQGRIAKLLGTSTD